MIIKLITQLARIIVGALFIFSGFVKLIDPIGSQYKFQEYFSEGVLNMEFLIPYALPFAILLIVAEIVLGVMILIGYKPKLTVWSLFLLTLIYCYKFIAIIHIYLLRMEKFFPYTLFEKC